ncbi:MAG: HAMP domain-containing histidine kinase [Candidatus Eremiobacteraeota bacterium]|nr:HAMP domain-containing histidine kinase [Candidatus Eremiobacteraeota bacterium]MCW5869616.1 HAMP domain-containing histidine kinase [Candidatus Eremiobacteraeota bacterium]
MEGLTRRILLWSLGLSLLLALVFLWLCRLDPGPGQQLYEIRLQTYEAARALGLNPQLPRHEFGRANLPPYLGRGRGELLLWLALLVGLGALASWRVARPIEQALGHLAEDCQRLERGQAWQGGAQAGPLAGINQDFALMLAALERQQQELNQATRDAQQALSLRESLLTRSHAEFRQPLQAMLESLRGQPDHPYIQTIRRNLQVLLRLVDDLAAQQPVLRWETVDLREFLRETLEAFPQRVRLLSGPGVKLELDRLRSAQALLNLVGNALKYSEKEVTVSWGEDWVEVRDQGQGMAAEDIPELMREFRQQEPGRQEGVGLGLHTARRWMELQGGQLQIESQPGQGTRARLIFFKSSQSAQPS